VPSWQRCLLREQAFQFPASYAGKQGMNHNNIIYHPRSFVFNSTSVIRHVRMLDGELTFLKVGWIFIVLILYHTTATGNKVEQNEMYNKRIIFI
jgi:hypothetical protein